MRSRCAVSRRPDRHLSPCRRVRVWHPILLGLALAASARAADYYWDADGNTSTATGYSGSTQNSWRLGATYLTWRTASATGDLVSWSSVDAATATAVFGGDLAGSVWIYSSVSANQIRFERVGYTIASLPLTLVGVTPTIATDFAATISAPLAGTQGMRKTGTGQLSLTGASTYTGTTIVDNGTLLLYQNGVLNGTAAVVVNTGGTLSLQASERINDAASLTVAGGTFRPGDETLGAVTLNSGTITGASSAKLTSATNFELQSGTVDVMLLGATPAVGLNKTTAGTVTLTGNNTFSGKTTVSGGTLVLAYTAYNVRSNYTLANTSEVEIGAGATVRLGPLGNQINDAATLSIDGGTFHLGTYAETLAGVRLLNSGLIKNGKLTSTTAFDLRSGTVEAGLGGTAGLVKSTGGTVVLKPQLNVPYDYTGATSITGGLLVANGTFKNSVAEADRVTIAEGARLAGCGSLRRLITVQAGGTIAAGDPAASLGTLTTNAQTWADGSFATFRLSNIAADSFLINGPLTAGNATVTLTSFGFDPVTLQNATWTLASTTADITGFTNLALDTTALGAYPGTFSLGLANGDNNLVLHYTAIPEPTTCALVGGLTTLALVAFDRQRRANHTAIAIRQRPTRQLSARAMTL